ncbi:3'-5' exonuclease [Streptomyces polyrhachis]|uniref:3'-5' exonuclease n=1 Tax=Streptomyces polyrhachis TaxID=1282885 RepID=A0ABW2GDG7_9ACTN
MESTTLWYEGPLAAFGVETTGADTEHDRIVCAALVVQHQPSSPPRVTRWLVSPGVEVPAAATRAHGLTESHLQHFGRWPSPVMEEVGRALSSHAAAGVPLVVMDAPFGLTLLDRELRRHRNSSLATYLGTGVLCVLDPRVLDGHLDPQRPGGSALADLCAAYEVVRQEGDDPHDTAARALAALTVVRSIGRRHRDRIGAHRLAELHARQAVWHAAQARGPQAWFAKPGEALPDPAWPLRPELPHAA